MTTPIHQQKGQHCGNEKGSQETQKPEPMGRVVKSASQTWLGYFEVTTRGFTPGGWAAVGW